VVRLAHAQPGWKDDVFAVCRNPCRELTGSQQFRECYLRIARATHHWPSSLRWEVMVTRSGQIKSNQIWETYYSTPPPELWGTCYSRLKIIIHNNYYKMRLGYVLKGRKWSIGWSCECEWVALLTVHVMDDESLAGLETVLLGGCNLVGRRGFWPTGTLRSARGMGARPLRPGGYDPWPSGSKFLSISSLLPREQRGQIFTLPYGWF